MTAALAVSCLLAGAAHPAPDDGTNQTGPTVHEVAYTWGGEGEVDTGVAGARLYGTCPNQGCVIIEVEEGHRFVEVEVVDDSGLPVLAASRTQGVPSVCGSTDLPLRLGRGLEALEFAVAVGTCGTGPPSVPTTGVLRITLHTVDPLA